MTDEIDIEKFQKRLAAWLNKLPQAMLQEP
jgi:hypothetical protein